MLVTVSLVSKGYVGRSCPQSVYNFAELELKLFSVFQGRQLKPC